MRSLYENKYYMDTIQGHQECMIGYSDSGKDAGRLAAAWALFKVKAHLTLPSSSKIDGGSSSLLPAAAEMQL